MALQLQEGLQRHSNLTSRKPFSLTIHSSNSRRRNRLAVSRKPSNISFPSLNGFPNIVCACSSLIYLLVSPSLALPTFLLSSASVSSRSHVSIMHAYKPHTCMLDHVTKDNTNYYLNLAIVIPCTDSCVVPSIVYAIFGNSKHVAVGTLGTSSLLIAETINKVASPEAQPALYLHLIFTVTFVTGIFQAALGFQRMGMLVDFLSHSTITGFMGGTATIICLQQFKGFFGLTHFTTKTDVISVMHALIEHRDEVCFFALLKNEQDGNKEMIAFGLMNLAGSFTSCYLTIDSNVKHGDGNLVALTLLFLAPFFSYTPLIALCAVIISATLGLIKYEEAIKLFKVDKFDFCICMTALLKSVVAII
ncbi:hypothetical protein Prudu_020581 [Prunus dulcis]|uniref:SLC26A/SulP transporter domain-containing protein n=1 Tax=Prunus dulcis TaxID=3755 RepID=A0A4Y1RXE7_PRUDU|nr:hypothetical protein Prudu_020581 [Prunus dulcis]